MSIEFSIGESIIDLIVESFIDLPSISKL